MAGCSTFAAAVEALGGRLATVPANKKAISRPLKVLIPLIQSELQMGNDAGREHYRRAGEMLLEAQSQVARGGWGTWLKKNFDLSRATAYAYMGWARVHNEASSGTRQLPGSHAQMRGETERRREDRQSKQQQDFRRTLRDVAREEFVQERQTRDDEIKLHRELAEELVDLGYRALATHLHPDRGGSRVCPRMISRLRRRDKTTRPTTGGDHPGECRAEAQSGEQRSTVVVGGVYWTSSATECSRCRQDTDKRAPEYRFRNFLWGEVGKNCPGRGASS